RDAKLKTEFRQTAPRDGAIGVRARDETRNSLRRPGNTPRPGASVKIPGAGTGGGMAPGSCRPPFSRAPLDPGAADRAEHRDRTLVLDRLGGALDLLEGSLHVAIEGLIVYDTAGEPLPLIDLREDLAKACHRLG